MGPSPSLMACVALRAAAGGTSKEAGEQLGTVFSSPCTETPPPRSSRYTGPYSMCKTGASDFQETPAELEGKVQGAQDRAPQVPADGASPS